MAPTPTDTELDWLQAHHLDGRTRRDPAALAAAFGERFGRDVSAAWVRDVVDGHCRSVQAEADGRLLLTWSQHRFLVDAYQDHTLTAAAELLNARYGTACTGGQLKHYLKRRGVRKQPAYMTIGYEAVRNTGHGRRERMVKVAHGRGADNMRPKRIVVWEAAHGPVPDGHVVAFLVGDDCVLDNLVLLSYAERLYLNRIRWQQTLAPDRAVRRAVVAHARRAVRAGVGPAGHAIGTEIFRKATGGHRGEIRVKVATGRGEYNMRPKRIVVWEEAHGPVPRGHAVLPLVGDDCTLDNLVLLSRAEQIFLNRMHWRELPPCRETRRAAVATARLKALAAATERRAHG